MKSKLSLDTISSSSELTSLSTGCLLGFLPLAEPLPLADALLLAAAGRGTAGLTTTMGSTTFRIAPGLLALLAWLLPRSMLRLLRRLRRESILLTVDMYCSACALSTSLQLTSSEPYCT